MDLDMIQITVQEEAMEPQRNPVLIVAQKSMLLFVAQMAQHTITNVKWKLQIVRMSQRQSFGHLREHVNHNQAIELGNFLLFGRRISNQI